MKLPFAFGLASGICLMGQELGTVGYGYVLQAKVYVAPGQLVTLIVSGVGNDLRQTIRTPGGADLPTSLGGISVGYFQPPSNGDAPILEVRPFSTCSNPSLRT